MRSSFTLKSSLALSMERFSFFSRWSSPSSFSTPPALELLSTTSFTCNYILTLDKSKYELAQYLYGCLFAPAIPTLEAAIRKGNLQSWPGIDTINFKKYVGKNIAHEKGHLDQERQNLRSTKLTTSTLTSAELQQDAFPEQTTIKCHHCYSIILPAPEKTEKGIPLSKLQRSQIYLCDL